ncbi:MAG: YbfB/YjiJ family MFS transporter, partial [Hyphomicrobiaceae bacterium]
GLIASANYLGYLIGALAAAWIRLPGGARRWFLSALVVSFVTTGAMALADSMALYLAIRFASGVASAFVLVLASTLVLARVTAAGRQGLFSLHFAGVGSGIAISAVLVASMAAAGFDWRSFWLAGGFLAALAWFAALMLVPGQSDDQVAAVPPGESNGRLGSPVRMLILSYGLFGFGYVILGTFISAMVRDTPDIQALESSIWLIVGLAGIPSVAVWTWVAKRWGYGFSYAVAAVTQAAGTAISILATAPAVVIGAITLGGTLVGLTAIGLVHARNLTQHDPRLVLGLMTGSFGAGQIAGPLFAGFVSDATGTLTIPLLGAAVALLGCAVLTPEPMPRPVPVG